KWFQAQVKNMKQGQGIGGRAMNVGYGLWALKLSGWKANETTEAMVTYLLKTQNADGHWQGQVARPPLEESFVTATVLSAEGMRQFATPAQKPQVEAALARAKRWILQAPLNGQEDKAFKLWGVELLDCAREERRSARAAVLAAQQKDGGWPQMEGMNSDAYATGQSLFELHATG